MAGHSPSRPGWYTDLDEPWSLRYWDGRAWAHRSRPRPAWSSQTARFEVSEDEIDRSVEGPAHPDELRTPVASGAWLSSRLSSLRPHRPDHPLAGPVARSVAPAHPSSPVPADRFGQARRPLLVVALLVVMAAAIVISSVAVAHPPTPGSPAQTSSGQSALTGFTGRASKYCVAILPEYRAALEAGVDGPSVAAASHQVDLLRYRLAAIPTDVGIADPVKRWLEAWQSFTNYQRRYASLIGPASEEHGRLAARSLSRTAEQAAYQARYQAEQAASMADSFSATFRVPACELQSSPRR